MCIVHLIRSSTRQVAYSEMKEVAADLKPIYTAPNAGEAERQLDTFDKKWGEEYPMIAKSWRSVWPNVVPFFKFPDDIRRAIYTTNAIESVNASIRHITKNRALFPNDEAVFKLLYLALDNASKKWTRNVPWECRSSIGSRRCSSSPSTSQIVFRSINRESSTAIYTVILIWTFAIKKSSTVLLQSG